MIAHVAAAAEASGRVLLWLDPDVTCSRGALKAAVEIASAHAADIETVVIDGPSMVSLRDIPSACVSATGRRMSPNGGDRIVNFRERLAERQRRDVDDLAFDAGVSVAHLSAPGDAIDRLAEMCLAKGPWNIITLGRAPGPDLAGTVSSILANVSGATAVVVAGRRDTEAGRDIAVIVEDVERMPSMIRAAQRLARDDGRIHVMISAETAADHREIEHQIRFVAADEPRLQMSDRAPTYGVAGAYDEDIFRLKPFFTIVRFAGALPGQTRALMRLLALSTGPLLLVR